MAGKSHFEVHIRTRFSAAHHLRGYPGDCERPHGHNWTVDVCIECTKLNSLGFGIDFRDVKAAVRKLLGQFDHCDLNTLPQFQRENPTCENVAKYIYTELARTIDAGDIRVTKVGVSETQTCGVVYWED
jgi:6-pyruvoyltetrahydropterin/6-carboxytetrahydropterin synthase